MKRQSILLFCFFILTASAKVRLDSSLFDDVTLFMFSKFPIFIFSFFFKEVQRKKLEGFRTTMGTTFGLRYGAIAYGGI